MNFRPTPPITVACSILPFLAFANGCATTKPPNEPFVSATPVRVVEVTGKIFPAVVRLDVAQEIYRDGKRTVQRGIGSGVIFDKSGKVLTNYHVAGRSSEIYLTLFNKERVRGTLVGDDHWTDLAIVQIDMDEVARKNITFSYAELGTSKGLLPGQDVMAVGTPFGLARTMTLGVVSNNERTFYPEQMKIDEYETGNFANWIQMDTPINPGNSGGPLVDLNGKVVGINTRGGGQNLNFAVPIDTAKEVVAKILASAKPDQKGHVERSDLGIEFKPLQDLEKFYSMDINQGVLVDNVVRGSTAQKAGVKTQDILLSINGKPTNCRFPEEIAGIRKMIADLPVDSDVKLSIRRGKETVEIATKTQRLESSVGEEREFKQWGLSARDVTRVYAAEQQLDSADGVVITTLNPGYPAAKAQLQAGDVILSVNGEKIVDLDSLSATYKKLTDERTTSIVIGLQRDRARRTEVLKVTYDKATTEPK